MKYLVPALLLLPGLAWAFQEPATTSAPPIERPAAPWPLSPYAGEPPNMQNLWSSLTHVQGGSKELLTMAEGEAFVLRQVWLAAAPPEPVEFRVVVPGGPREGYLLQLLESDRRDWESAGYRLNPGESLLVRSRGAADVGYTGTFIEP